MTKSQALTCRHGKYRWVDWQVVSIPGGYGVRASCDLGDHWLVTAAPYPVIISLQHPFAWATAEEAERALRIWAEQGKDDQ